MFLGDAALRFGGLAVAGIFQVAQERLDGRLSHAGERHDLAGVGEHLLPLGVARLLGRRSSCWRLLRLLRLLLRLDGELALLCLRLLLRLLCLLCLRLCSGCSG